VRDEEILKQFDEWLAENSEFGALVMRQWFISVEGKDAVIFPPTYAPPKKTNGKEKKEEKEWLGYNIDCFPDGKNMCLIDSVGSQANRMESLFVKKPYDSLVPQVQVEAGNLKVDLLVDAGHRAADAVVRFSDLSGKLDEAFLAFKNNGNAQPLAKISPTSFVFGVWDSRATQVKFPRIVRSVIYAFNVKPLHRSAQYGPAVDYVGKGLLESPQNKTEKDAMAQLGLTHAPAPWTHGGVLAEGGIRRDATLNLVPLRTLGAVPQEDYIKVRRYILGLSLVSLTAPQEMFFREGCLLVPDMKSEAEYSVVKHSGQRAPFNFSHEDVVKYAVETAKDFVVGDPQSAEFDAKRAKRELKLTKEERKKARRGEGLGPENSEGI
jgi:CRISPR-associated protein Csb1